jgi:hypothetical protein
MLSPKGFLVHVLGVKKRDMITTEFDTLCNWMQQYHQYLQDIEVENEKMLSLMGKYSVSFEQFGTLFFGVIIHPELLTEKDATFDTEYKMFRFIVECYLNDKISKHKAKIALRHYEKRKRYEPYDIARRRG